MAKKAIIIGAGPAGLTAAYELLKRTDIKPIILEKSGDIGGISKTINYKGNRMDIGGHRFFSKSDRVMKWWMNIMPLQATEDNYTTITYQRKHRTIVQEESHLHVNADDKKVMLVRKRLSRIYFLRKFFTYPIQLSIDTLQKLGLIRTIKILLSYLFAQLVPRKPEKSLEDFMINRFGRQLYLLFFKDYTEKVWGVPCNEISAEWGAQRIKGISISKAIQHAAKSLMQKKKGTDDIAQKDTETSLIEQFLYPALGPGQLWEEVARQIEVLGGTIVMNQDVKEVKLAGNKVCGVVAVNSKTGEEQEYEGDYFFSTMPVQELVAGMNGKVPTDVKEVAAGLQYRDFITVGILLERLAATDTKTGEITTLDLKDTWIYIQEKDVKVGRLQLFNNWSPFMVNKEGNVWVGMEYFCNKGDEFWCLTDEEIQRNAIRELEKMGLAQVQDVLDSTVHRVEKTYPAYFGTYNEFDKIRAFVDQFENLFLVGRNGMHKYNNSDHSMLTAMTAVDNICEGVTNKENIWAINTEQEYHEVKKNAELGDNKNSEPDILGRRPATHLPSFRNYFFKDITNRNLLVWLSVLLLIEFAVFKYFYPFASFINGDSYNYLETAYQNYSINTYPIGYPKFLRLVSVFTNSDLVLIAIQYFTLQIALLTFLFTIFYFFQPRFAVRVFLLIFINLNPVFLYLSNYVSSDVLFLTLSTLWLTLLLWIVYRPSTRLILIHGLVIFFAFIVRYNALFYPLISILAFFLSKQRWRIKLAGVSFGLILIVLFIVYTGNKYQRLTGKWQFSPFSGWQIANNALYAYKFVNKADRKPVPEKYRKLDNMVTAFFDSTKDYKKYPNEKLMANTAYMWSPGTPLREYMKRTYPFDSITGPLKPWASCGPLLSSYGSFLIQQYPIPFFKYYLSPNMVKYYAPPLEFLEQYSMGRDTVALIAQVWFGYRSNKVTTRVKDFNVHTLDFLPIFIGGLHMVFLFGLLGYLILGGWKAVPGLQKAIILVVFLWISNFSFSVFASPITLRFQLFMVVVSVTVSCLFIEYIIKVAVNSRVEPVPITSEVLQLS